MEPIQWTAEKFLEWFLAQKEPPHKRDSLLLIDRHLQTHNVDRLEGRRNVAIVLDAKLPDLRLSISQRRALASLIEGLR